MQEPSVLGCEIQLWETKSKKFWSHELPKRFTTLFEALWTVLNGFLRGQFKSGQVALQIVINRLKNKDLIIETCDHLTFRCIEKFWTFTHFLPQNGAFWASVRSSGTQMWSGQEGLILYDICSSCNYKFFQFISPDGWTFFWSNAKTAQIAMWCPTLFF